MNSVCIFAGARSGNDSRYIDSAVTLGQEIARRKINLVYGGGNNGVMGALAKAASSAGAIVTGVSANQVRVNEIRTVSLYCHEFIVAKSMHSRREEMFQRSDAFIALPGGLGTLEELLEIWSWRHLGIHDKPVGLLNVGGFWNPLVNYIEELKVHGFVRENSMLDPIIDSNVSSLLSRLTAGVAVSLSASVILENLSGDTHND